MAEIETSRWPGWMALKEQLKSKVTREADQRRSRTPQVVNFDHITSALLGWMQGFVCLTFHVYLHGM